MPVLRRVFRLTLVSAAWAAAVAIAWFAVLMLAWWYIPPITAVSIAHACAPRHAVGSSACVFVVVFGLLFLVGAPESVMRPMLFGEDELTRSRRRGRGN